MKRTELIIETERVVIVNQHHDRATLWCKRCTRAVPMLTLEEAATVARAPFFVLFRLMEAGRLEFAVTPEDKLFICPAHLFEGAAEA